MCVPITTTVDADTCIVTTPCIIYSITILTSAGGHGVDVYDDNHANSERLQLSLEAPNNEAKTFNFGPGVKVYRGLYLDLSASCDYVTIVYAVLPKENK